MRRLDSWYWVVESERGSWTITKHDSEQSCPWRFEDGWGFDDEDFYYIGPPVVYTTMIRGVVSPVEFQRGYEEIVPDGNSYKRIRLPFIKIRDINEHAVEICYPTLMEGAPNGLDGQTIPEIEAGDGGPPTSV